MTRETKIGLLVGLAFIIVIGILLSDHLTSSTEPPPAPLAGAGSSVRSAVTTPAGAGNPPITPVVTTPQVTPQQTVLTRNELAQHTPPVQIDVGGPSNPQRAVPSQLPNQVSDSSQPDNATSSSNGASNNSGASSGDPNVTIALRDAAKQQGLEIVS